MPTIFFGEATMSIEKAIEDLRGLGRADAEQLGDHIRDLIIDDMLQRDPEMPRRCYYVWQLALNNVRARIVETVYHLINNRIDRDDVLNELNFYGLQDTEVDGGPLDVEER
jgi:hypothetical protein